MKKMTKKDYFVQLMNNYDLKEDELEFVKHEIELLEKKNSGTKKPTATQVANAEIKEEILANMETGKKYTITDLMKCVPACTELSNQRVSALVRQLLKDDLVVRTEEKRKAYFHKVE